MTTEGMLRSFVDRIERLKDEQDALSSDIRDVYAETKSNGFDKTALGKVVAIRRATRKDPAKAEELDAIVRLYLDTLEGREPSHTHTHAREEIPRSDHTSKSTAARNDAGKTGVTAGETAAFQRKPFVLRPHCQHPEICRSGTSDHCWSCLNAIGATPKQPAPEGQIA